MSQMTVVERAVVLVVLAILGTVYVWGAQFWIDPFEEGYFAALAIRVAEGAHPYRDFATPYTPGFFYLHALLFHVLGETLFGQRVGVVLARIVGAGLLYLLARRVAPPRYALLAPASLLLLDPAPVPWQTHPSWYAAPAASAAALAMVRFLDCRRPTWLLAAGVCAGLSFAFKQNIGLLTLLALGSFVVCAGPLACLSPNWGRWCDSMDAMVPRPLGGSARIAGAVALPLAILWALRVAPSLEYLLEYVMPLAVLNAWIWRKRLSRTAGFARDTLLAGLVAAGFAAVTVPWLVAMIAVVGRSEVPLRQFVGGVDPSGYILDQWWPRPEGLLTLALGPALVLVCWLLARQRFARALALLLSFGALVAIAAGFVAPPGSDIQGRFSEVLLLATENVNQLLPAVAAGLVVLALVSGWASARDEMPLAWLVTFGCAIYFHQYPRMDEPHLIFSAPPILAALAWFLTRVEARILGGSAHLTGDLLKPLLAVAMLAGPILSFMPVTHWRWSMVVLRSEDGLLPRGHDYVAVTASRAGVLALPYVAEPLGQVANVIQARTARGSSIFVFPATPLFYYLADRPNATRYYHFLAGLVSSEEEQEAVRRLDEGDVRLIVIDPAFEQIWLRDDQYAGLREYLRSEFVRTMTIGPYEIWER